MAPEEEVCTKYYKPFSSIQINPVVKCGHDEVVVLNVYTWPVNCCEPRHMPNISPLSEGNNRPLLEDLNDHHEFWHSVLDNDQRSNRSTFHTEIEDSSNPNKRGHCSSDMV